LAALQALNDCGKLIEHDVGAIVEPVVLEGRRATAAAK
jgi:hypothetical protein